MCVCVGGRWKLTTNGLMESALGDVGSPLLGDPPNKQSQRYLGACQKLRGSAGLVSA